MGSLGHMALQETQPPKRLRSSFRDPGAFVFRSGDGIVLRQINASYASHYDQLMASGLYEELTHAGLLLPHAEVGIDAAFDRHAHRVLRPEQLTFITHPFEWPFSALKNAALLTLDIQLRALRHGMTLKDASAYNVQFIGTKPVFIDTSSFIVRHEDAPWVAYRQFCQHFLAPLALTAYKGPALSRLSTLFVDGVPLPVASSLLPWRSLFRFGTLVHLHAQAEMIERYSSTSRPAHKASPRVPTNRLIPLIENLQSTVQAMRWNPPSSEWKDYYSETSYSENAFAEKQRLVKTLIAAVRPATVWDLGANVGLFSRAAAAEGARVCAFDIEPECAEINYRECLASGVHAVTPLVLDLANPSPGIGWAHCERASLKDRGPVDLVMGLALIHHLAISNNVPLEDVASYLRELGKHLIIEFVPKEDVQVQRLLRSREDVFGDYTQENFESAFRRCFNIESRHPVGESGRLLYLMASRDHSG